MSCLFHISLTTDPTNAEGLKSSQPAECMLLNFSPEVSTTNSVARVAVEPLGSNVNLEIRFC